MRSVLSPVRRVLGRNGTPSPSAWTSAPAPFSPSEKANPSPRFRHHTLQPSGTFLSGCAFHHKSPVVAARGLSESLAGERLLRTSTHAQRKRWWLGFTFRLPIKDARRKEAAVESRHPKREKLQWAKGVKYDGRPALQADQ